MPRVQELNAFAKVSVELKELDTLPDSFFRDFSVILLAECNEVCKCGMFSRFSYYDC
jgi:hypothetical protein